MILLDIREVPVKSKHLLFPNSGSSAGYTLSAYGLHAIFTLEIQSLAPSLCLSLCRSEDSEKTETQ
jgi:hypothetical protein